MFFMFSVPSPAASTCDLNMTPIANATSAMTPTMMTRDRLPPDRSTVPSALKTPETAWDIQFLRFGREPFDVVRRPGQGASQTCGLRHGRLGVY